MSVQNLKKREKGHFQRQKTITKIKILTILNVGMRLVGIHCTNPTKFWEVYSFITLFLSIF